jgi:ribosomal protein L18E
MDHLDSPQLRDAARSYAEAAKRFSSAPFWRRKNARLELKSQRREYVRELIRTAEARRLEV